MREKLTGPVISAVAVGMFLFFVYTAVYGLFAPVIQRGTILLAGMVVAYLLSTAKKAGTGRTLVLPVILALLSVVVVLYFMLRQDAIILAGGEASPMDLIAGAVLMLLVLEATRRQVGWSLPILAVIFLAYVYFGPSMPGVLRHRGVSLSYMIVNTTILTQGIWGLALQVAANYVFPFILLASILNAAGVGEAFLRLSQSLVGTTRGGPAKIAVVASGFFGSISGSAVANVAATGTFTIPLMKRVGYKPEFAAGVEAVASSGGQFTPPIMAATAFIIAEILNVSYYDVITAAALPAFLFYLAILVIVDLEAARIGLKGLSKVEIPRFWPTFKASWHLFLPLMLLTYLLVVSQYSPIRSGIWSIAAAFVVSFASPRTRLTLNKLIESFRNATVDIAGIAVVCATAGIILSVIDLAGLPMKLSQILLSLAGGSLPLLLVLTMIASIILGTGLPTVAAYVILAVMVVPALQTLGVNPMASHLFVFYFGILSFITPPVALAAYVAAGIAGANPLKTCWCAMRLGLAGFIVPYMFVYGPALLLDGPVIDVVWAAFTAVIGIIGLAAALQGYLFRSAGLFERILLAAGALGLINHGLLTDLVGASCLAVAVILQFRPRSTTTHEPTSTVIGG